MTYGDSLITFLQLGNHNYSNVYIQTIDTTASANLNIAFNLTENNKIEIKLYNSIGEQVANIFRDGSIGVNEFKLDVALLPVGIYFAQLNLEGNITSTRKFVVSK